jgi:lauroyl/myristoyl acyltransferase
MGRELTRAMADIIEEMITPIPTQAGLPSI